MRSEDPTLDQLFAATRTLERRATRQRLQLRSNVAARLTAAGVGLSAQALASGATAGASTWLSAIKLKLVVACVAVGGAAAGGAVLLPQVVRHSDIAGGATAAERALPWPHAPELSAAAAIASLPVPKPEVPAASEPVARVAKGSSPSEKDPLAEELELVRGAQSELAKGHANQVLARLERYFQRFPRGILQPEARATRVRALCQAGRRAESAREAERFTRTHPDSPLARQLGTCKSP